MRKCLPILTDSNTTASHHGPHGTEPTRGPNLELPSLHQTQLDWDAIDCVLADLDDFASILEIQGRDAEGTAVVVKNIFDAQQRFVAGTLAALQIVYTFADQEWCDTLLRDGTGGTLVRMLSQARENSS